jgi:hypothetical protein
LPLGVRDNLVGRFGRSANHDVNLRALRHGGVRVEYDNSILDPTANGAARAFFGPCGTTSLPSGRGDGTMSATMY